jgi:hypothetical protein
MVWDFGLAMRKKEEFESERLMNFEFLQRVRATRLFARKIGLNEASLVGEIAVQGSDDLLDWVAKSTSRSRDDIGTAYEQCLGEARQQLIAERGDPAPNRLA